MLVQSFEHNIPYVKKSHNVEQPNRYKVPIIIVIAILIIISLFMLHRRHIKSKIKTPIDVDKHITDIYAKKQKLKNTLPSRRIDFADDTKMLRRIDALEQSLNREL